MQDCLFCRIVRGEIPAAKVFEDDDVLAFKDIQPQRPVHVLVIPKKHITSLAHVSQEDVPVLGKILAKANEIAVAQGSPEGFRVIINTGCVGRSGSAAPARAYRGRS